MATADRTAPVTGVRPVLRRGAVCLACATLLAFGASGCKSPVTPAAVPASPAAKAPATAPADPACPQALGAVSAYGPAALRDAVGGQEVLDQAEIGLVVLALNEAANSAGSSGVKRSIVNLVSAYLKLRESLNGTIDSAIEKRVLANTSNLKSECGS
jgi:hypothetical protein